MRVPLKRRADRRVDIAKREGASCFPRHKGKKKETKKYWGGVGTFRDKYCKL